jgi:outer membrane protein OmpA-like peptidoglycan-associated protein
MFSARNFRFITLTAALACGAAPAETVRYYGAGQTPDPQTVASILGAAKPAKRMKMRGGELLDEPAAQTPRSADSGRDLTEDPLLREQALSSSAHNAVQAWQTRVGHGQRAPGALAAVSTLAQSTAPAPARSVALAIGFDNDSARLQNAAAQSLAAVAEGMRLAGFSHAYVIEGHTSATGPRAHNLRLSRERAASVKRFLVQHHGVPAAALRTIGLGSSAPLKPNDPNAPENRRVQFRSA